MEVLNDRYAGVTDFYRCIRSKHLFEALLARLELTVHSKEDFVYCKDWETFEDPVERAACWYTLVSYSFGSLGRNWGRATAPNGRLSGKVRNALPKFAEVHERLKYVQVENQDWYYCMKDYDNPDTVFYLDPPYHDSYRGTYKHELSLEDHKEMLDYIFKCEGFVALSGYENPYIDSLPWSSRHEWESFVSIKPAAFTEGNNKKGTEGNSERGNAVEVLWIKEAGYNG
jgi:DNA adenine methylase